MATVTTGTLIQIDHGSNPTNDPNLASVGEVAAAMLIDSAAISTATSKAVSTVNAAAPDSSSISTASSKADSSGTRASVADSKAVSDSGTTSVADSKALSVSVNTSKADSKAVSVGTATVVPVVGGIPGFQQPLTGSVVRTANSKMAEVLSVVDFGATGNGTTDDTTAIAAAITAAAISGARVYLPPGTYKITSGLTVPGDSNVGLFGCGFASTIKPVGTFNALTIGTTSADNTTHAIFEGFSIDGTNLTGNGLTVNRMHSITLRRIRVQFCTGVGVVNFHSYASSWENVYANNNTSDGLTIGDACDLSVYRDCKFLANGASGVHFTSGDSSGCRFYNCDFEGNTDSALKVDTLAAVMETLDLIGCYFENNLAKTMQIANDGGGSAQVRNLNVIGCHFNPGVGTSSACAIALDRVAVATFIGNKFNTVQITKTSNTSAVLIDQSNQWGSTADCPTDVLQSMPLMHLLMRSVESGKVDFGTDADWEVYFLQNNVRRWRLIQGDATTSFPKGSLLPAAGLANGQNPHLGVATVPIQAGWLGSIGLGQVATNVDRTFAMGDRFVDFDASGGLRTFTLPDANTFPGLELAVGKSDASANNVKLLPVGGQTINSAANLQFNTQYMVKTVKAVNGAWRAW